MDEESLLAEIEELEEELGNLTNRAEEVAAELNDKRIEYVQLVTEQADAARGEYDHDGPDDFDW